MIATTSSTVTDCPPATFRTVPGATSRVPAAAVAASTSSTKV
jgi:hypothetical protein